MMNYTRAAEQLNLTQPAVSQHIRWLEEQCGVKLFHYENKQLNLTAAGQMLRSAAITMKQDQMFCTEGCRRQTARTLTCVLA